MKAWARGLAGLLVAILLTAVSIGYSYRQVQDPHITYTRFNLPAFDAFVYVAMAEHPEIFTLAPWGYRALTPWVVHALPVPKVIRGFRYVNLFGLSLAAVLLYLFLRRLGFVLLPALAGSAAFALSAPVAEALRYGFLAEPLSVALLVGFLLALESGASLGVLCLLMALGSFSKEIFLVLPPLVFLESQGRVGWRRAVARTLLVALPGLLVTLLLREWWAPQQTSTLPLPEPSTLVQGLGSIARKWSHWWWPLLMGGVLPLGLLGLLRRDARGFLGRYGYLLAATLALPFVAGVYTGESELTTFFSGDVVRLLLYALPLWIPLALLALAPWVRRQVPPPMQLPVAGRRLAAVATVLLLLWIPLGLDRYRRVDLQGPRDGPYVLGLVRESLRTAGRLARGESVSFDPETQRFAWGVSDPGSLGRMRWFLREGWGPQAHYGIHDIVMRGDRAELLLPCLRPEALVIELVLETPSPVRLGTFVNGQRLDDVQAGPDGTASLVAVPAEALFRGDNRLSLVAKGRAEKRIRLRRLSYRPAGNRRGMPPGGMDRLSNATVFPEWGTSAPGHRRHPLS